MNTITTIKLFTKDREVIVNEGSDAEKYYRELGFSDKKVEIDPAAEAAKAAEKAAKKAAKEAERLAKELANAAENSGAQNG